MLTSQLMAIATGSREGLCLVAMVMMENRCSNGLLCTMVEPPPLTGHPETQ